MGFQGDSVSDGCVEDLEAQRNYLGPLQVPIYYNDETFDRSEYGSSSIKRSSKITRAQINEQKPEFFSFDF